jgi:hypothetical protein
MALGWPFTVTLNSPALVADPVSVRDSHLEGVHYLGEVRSLGDSATLGAEATQGLPSDQSTSVFPETPDRFLG